MAMRSPAGGGFTIVPSSERLAAHRELLVLLEHGVELEGVRDALPGEPHDEAAALGELDMVRLDQMAQKDAQVVGGDPVEVGQGEHPSGEFGGGELAAAGEGRHHLVVEQAVGEPVEPGRLDPLVLAVQLHERDALQQLPRYGLREHRARLGLLLAHHEVHLGREVAPTGAAHALQERRDGEGGVDLEGALEPADVDAQLERRGRHGRERHFLVAHQLLGGLAEGGGQVAVVDEEAVGLAPRLAVLAQHGADRLGLLAGVDEHEALAPAGVLEDVGEPRVGVGRRGVGRGHELGLGDLGDGHLGVRPPPVRPLSPGAGPRRAVGSPRGRQLGRRLGVLRPVEQVLQVGDRLLAARPQPLAAHDLGGHRGTRLRGALRRLGPGDVEMLHGQAPGARAAPRSAG